MDRIKAKVAKVVGGTGQPKQGVPQATLVQAAAAPAPPPPPRNYWDESPCEACCAEPKICCEACGCGCLCVNAKISSFARTGRPDSSSSCCDLFCGLCLCCLCRENGLFGAMMGTRSNVRDKVGMTSDRCCCQKPSNCCCCGCWHRCNLNCWASCCTVFVCPCCALAQEYRELQLHFGMRQSSRLPPPPPPGAAPQSQMV